MYVCIYVYIYIHSCALSVDAPRACAPDICIDICIDGHIGMYVYIYIHRCALSVDAARACVSDVPAPQPGDDGQENLGLLHPGRLASWSIIYMYMRRR